MVAKSSRGRELPVEVSCGILRRSARAVSPPLNRVLEHCDMKRLINRSTILGMTLGASVALAAGYATVNAQNGATGGRPAVIATVQLATVVEKLDKRAAEFANLQAFRAQAQKEQETRKA